MYDIFTVAMARLNLHNSEVSEDTVTFEFKEYFEFFHTGRILP